MPEVDLSRLKDPFPASDIEWRIGRAGSSKDGKPWARVLAYITARACMDRLDEVVGPGNWSDSYEFVEKPVPGVMCQLSLRVKDDDGDGLYGGSWTRKNDGAEVTDIEPFKGGISGAFKRACSKWGIGRYLYHLKDDFAQVSTEKPSNLKDWHYHSDKSGAKFWWKAPPLPEWALPGAPPSNPPTLQDEVPKYADGHELTVKYGEELFLDGTKYVGKKFGDFTFEEREQYLEKLLIGINKLEKAEPPKPVDASIKAMSVKLARSVGQVIAWNGVLV